MNDVEKDQIACKTNMVVVDKLLSVISDWQKIVIPRHVKFVECYFKYNKNLTLAGQEFNFTERDMLFIFWRIQKTLQEEYCKRVLIGDINRLSYFYRVKEVPKKKQVIKTDRKLKSNVYNINNKSLN